MKALYSHSAVWLTAFLVVGTSIPTLAQEGAPIAAVRGQGTYQSDLAGDWRGEVSVNAWLNADGTSDGAVVWTAVDFSDSGPGYSGYPWYMVVTNLEVAGNMALVEAVVVYSPQFPEDEGLTWPFVIVDNGEGAFSSPDELFGDAIEAGNFAVWSDN